jgi:hypothetical protein
VVIYVILGAEIEVKSALGSLSAPFLSAPSRSSHGRLLYCNGETKVTAEELLARAAFNGYTKEPIERKTTLETMRDIDKTKKGLKLGVRLLSPVRDQYLTAVAKIGSDTS